MGLDVRASPKTLAPRGPWTVACQCYAMLVDTAVTILAGSNATHFWATRALSCVLEILAQNSDRRARGWWEVKSAQYNMMEGEVN